MGFPCVSTYSTHTGVSTFNHRLHFCHPSIRELASPHLSASRRSVIGFLPVLLHHHTGILERKLFKSSQDSRHVRTLRSPYSPVALKGDARRSVHNSAAFYHPNSGSSSVKSNRPLTETCSHQHTTNNSKLEWKMEGHRENLKRMLYQTAGSIHGDADGRKNVLDVSFSSHNSDNVVKKEDTSMDSLSRKSSSNFQDIMYETPQNVLTGQTKVNGITALKGCSTGTKECSKKISGLNTLSSDSIQCEPYTNGKKHNLDVYNTRPSGTVRSHESTSKVTNTLTKKSCEVVDPQHEQRTKLLRIYDEVLVVDDISTAKIVVQLLTTKYRHLIHACDTEVSNIDVKQETPVNHGEMTCFSIYSGPTANFGKGKSCIWVDLLDGDDDIIMVFAPFFEDPSIKKVWHNYSFDYHIIENYGINVSGFHADTMHLARLWDSSRRRKGGYSLEALTGDPMVMDTINSVKLNGTAIDSVISQKTNKTAGKISMKYIFGKKKLKKDGSEGKLVELAPVEILQREERILFICYSALDSISTLKLFESMKRKLEKMDWIFENTRRGNMYDFYSKYWLPFGNILVEMEAEGILVDRTHLSEIEKVAIMEQKIVADKFRNWATEYCPDARHMNVGSDTQIRQLFFGGLINPKNQDVSLPKTKAFKVPNVDNVIEEGKKSPLKFRTITLTKIGDKMQAECFTKSGWPSVSGDALKSFAGNVSANETILHDDEFQTDDIDNDSDDDAVSEEGETGNPIVNFEDNKADSVYGTAYKAFGGGKKGREACHAIAALREISSIDSLISNFILPLQGNHISGKDGKIHCSLNINTETGRLSARRPNLQNPPALEKDRYKIRKAFVAAPGKSLIVADYGQLELRILAHLTNCTSMLDAFKAGGDFHSRTAMNMYEYIRSDVEEGKVLLEWLPQPGEVKPPVPLLKDAYASERRKAKMLNFSIAYGKTANGLSRDWKVSIEEARGTLKLWYKDRKEVLKWQEEQKAKALEKQVVHTLLGRARNFPWVASDSKAIKNHNLRAAINAPVQGSAADVAMCAMLQIVKNDRLNELKWKLLLQVHDEVILEGPSETAEEAKAIVVECMSKPFDGHNMLKVDLVVDAKYAQSWYAAK